MKLRGSDALSRATPIAVRRRRLLLLPLALAGCAQPYVGGGGGYAPQPPAPERVATLDAEGRVEVLHDNHWNPGRDGMALFRGDEVRTFPASYALVSFLNGDRVWLDYDTRVRLGSIFTFFGRVFASVSGVFQIDSEFVAASSEGTEFTVTIGRGGSNQYAVAVKTGAVRCQPRRGRWRPVRLVAGQRLRAQGEALPVIEKLDGRGLQTEFGWIPSARRIPEQKPRTSTPPAQSTPPARSTPPPQSTPPVIR